MGARIVVIGAGPSGLMAAGRAAETVAGRAEVLLLERMSRPGNKLRLTGNGRCNLSHDCDLSQFLTHLGPTGSLLRNSLARFYVSELCDFLAAHGVPTRREPDGRIFPASDRAADVLAALQGYGRKQGVVLKTSSPVTEIIVSEGHGPPPGRGDETGSLPRGAEGAGPPHDAERNRQPGARIRPQIAGVRLENADVVEAQQVILATGGLSYPGTGSTGDGYRLAAQLGHTVTPPRPGLVPLVTREGFVPSLQGLSLRDLRATLLQGGKALASARGDLLFTHFGVSGPTILNLSSRLGAALDAGPLRLCLDLLPDLDESALDQRLRRDLAAPGKACYDLLLKGYVPRALGEVLMARSGIPRDRPLNQFTAEQRRRVAQWLKCFELTVVNTRPIEEAMVTVGGISTREIEPKTMASRLVRGLYLAGELIDVAGDTGGFNLQIAFTTGRIAGESAGAAAWRDSSRAPVPQ